MTPAAQCAEHPQQRAVDTCARCGNFMCAECSKAGTQRTCPRCRALTGATALPFSRTDYDFTRLWDFCFEAFKRDWVMLCVAVLILGGALFGVSMVVQVFQSIGQAMVGRDDTTGLLVVLGLGQLFSWVLQSVVLGGLLMGFIRLAIDVLHGGRADVGRLFSQVSKMGTFFLQWLISLLIFDLPVFLYLALSVVVALRLSGHSLPSFEGRPSEELFRDVGAVVLAVGPVVGLAWALAVVPIVWLYLPRQLVVHEIVWGQATAWEAIRRAFALASGHRLSILGYSFVSGLLMLLGMLLCCIGLLPAVAMWQLLTTGLYLSLRNGSDLPPPTS